MQSLASLLRDNGLVDSAATASPNVVVAVVDDQPVSRTLITRLLNDIDASINVQLFADPGKALSWVPSARPALIITDYRMPQMDGIEFIKTLRDHPHTKRTPIMLVTVLEDQQIKKRALQAGATDFLNKPIDHDECRARCRNLLELSNYQAQLLEQLAVRNAYIHSLRDQGQAADNAQPRDEFDVTEGGRYVLMEYQALYEVTSTLAAIDTLLTPWRENRSALEAAVKRPLQGSRKKS